MPDYNDFIRTFTQADTHIFRFQVYDTVTGLNVDINAWQNFWVTVKVNVTDADAAAIFQLSIGSGLSLADPSNGIVQATIPTAATSTLDHRRYALVADIQGKDASGRLWTLLRGQFIILPEVTRAIS